MPGAKATGMLAPSPISAHAMQELAAVAVTRDFRTESCSTAFMRKSRSATSGYQRFGLLSYSPFSTPEHLLTGSLEL